LNQMEVRDRDVYERLSMPRYLILAILMSRLPIVRCRRLEQHSHGHGNSSRLGGDHG
jgi:hypothetical protein